MSSSGVRHASGCETVDVAAPLEEAFVKRWEPLVTKIAGRYKAGGAQIGLEFEDLQAIARLGVLKACRTFDPAVSKETTWVHNCVFNVVIEAVRSGRARLGATRRNGIPPAIHVPIDVKELDGKPLGPWLKDERAELAFESIEFWTEVADWLPFLTKRERAVLIGLTLGLSKAEISQSLGISPSRVFQIKNQLVAKLLSPVPVPVEVAS